MAATDILNPTKGWDVTLGDSMNPSYGFTQQRASTRLSKKAIGGAPWTRETQNTGHTFTLSWLGRTWACVQRLRQFYEQFEDGFFTIVDWDGGGRHYVGRFTSEPQFVESANNKYDVQNVTFEEMPTVAMAQYPTDWTKDAVLLFPWNDFGDQKLATSDNWASATLGSAPSNISKPTLNSLPLTYVTTAGAGNWATYEYRGYGFRLYLLQGPAQGNANIYLDDVQVGGAVCYLATNNGPVIFFTWPSVPLDLHRVKVVCLGTKDAASSGTNIGWYAIEVMR